MRELPVEIGSVRLDPEDTIIGLSLSHRYADSEHSHVPLSWVGTKLLTHISGWETRSYVAGATHWARMTQQKRSYGYRCDAPGLKRHCDMVVTADAKGYVDITHRVISAEPIDWRSPVAPGPVPESVCCSICMRIRDAGDWRDPEFPVARMLAIPKIARRVIFKVCNTCAHAAHPYRVVRV